MDRQRHSGHQEAIREAQAMGRLMHTANLEAAYTAAYRIALELLGTSAVKMEMESHRSVYFFYDPEGTWAYFSRATYVFDNEEDAVLVALACSR
jgi:hypothetical protein